MNRYKVWVVGMQSVGPLRVVRNLSAWAALSVFRRTAGDVYISSMLNEFIVYRRDGQVSLAARSDGLLLDLLRPAGAIAQGLEPQGVALIAGVLGLRDDIANEDHRDDGHDNALYLQWEDGPQIGIYIFVEEDSQA